MFVCNACTVPKRYVVEGSAMVPLDRAITSFYIHAVNKNTIIHCSCLAAIFSFRLLYNILVSIVLVVTHEKPVICVLVFVSRHTAGSRATCVCGRIALF